MRISDAREGKKAASVLLATALLQEGCSWNLTGRGQGGKGPYWTVYTPCHNKEYQWNCTNAS